MFIYVRAEFNCLVAEFEHSLGQLRAPLTTLIAKTVISAIGMREFSMARLVK